MLTHYKVKPAKPPNLAVPRFPLPLVVHVAVSCTPMPNSRCLLCASVSYQRQLPLPSTVSLDYLVNKSFYSVILMFCCPIEFILPSDWDLLASVAFDNHAQYISTTWYSMVLMLCSYFSPPTTLSASLLFPSFAFVCCTLSAADYTFAVQFLPKTTIVTDPLSL